MELLSSCIKFRIIYVWIIKYVYQLNIVIQVFCYLYIKKYNKKKKVVLIYIFCLMDFQKDRIGFYFFQKCESMIDFLFFFNMRNMIKVFCLV